MTLSRIPDRKVYRFSAPAVAALAKLFAAHGYPQEVCIQAVEAVRFHTALRSALWYDWRKPFLWGARVNGVAGITLGDQVFLGSPEHLALPALLAHEAMHVVQQRHRRLLPFFTRYGWQWARLRLGGYSHQDAYYALPDEAEARAIEIPASTQLRHIQPWLIPA